jgi:hypothetical protein
MDEFSAEADLQPVVWHMNFDPENKDLGFVLVAEADLDPSIRRCLSETPDYWHFDSLNL